MAPRYEPKDLQPIMEELESANVRAAINVGSSLLEYALEKAIEAALRTPDTETDKNLLFRDHGILGTFSEKILAAFFMRVVGHETRRDLDLIRLMRNVVSHDMNPVTYDTPEIGSRIRSLYRGKDMLPAKETPPNHKGIFLGTVQFLTGALLTKAAHPQMGYESWEAVNDLIDYLNE